MANSSFSPVLERVSPVLAVDLTDITASANTNLVIGVNPVPDNTVSLLEGSITRVGDKAFVEMNYISDEGDRITLTFGTSIVPAGGRILNMTITGDIINSDQINPQIESDNQVSFDVAGSTADVNTKLSFWVDGYPDFIEYQQS